jgi:outer membrane lipoprotein-sorting protein
MDRRSFLSLGAAASLIPAFADAQTYYAANLTRAQKAQVEEAVAYLQGITTAKGRFTQTNSRGASSQGTLYLNRPGKARFEYDPPKPMVVVADGKNVSVYDLRLKAFDKYPQKATPLAIFLAKKVRLDTLTMITRFVSSEDGFQLTLRDSRGGVAGSLVMDFANAPVALRGWTVVDGSKTETRVRLASLDPTGPFEPALFTLTDPRRAG